MPKRNADNLRIKRKYLVWMKDARGYSEASIDKAAAAISTYEVFLAGKGFRAFHSEQVRAFKRHLTSKKTASGNTPLSASTVNSILRELKTFFLWLADQPGYKSRITHSDAAYLTPDRKSENARRRTLWKPHPSPAQVRKLLEEMPADTIVQRRDRALVAFLFLTASREGAAISLRLGDVDLANACVNFDGIKVNTKNGKTFTTGFFPIGGQAEQIVHDWIKELHTAQMFSDADPLFPRTKLGLEASRGFTVLGIDRAPWASPSSAAKIFKEAFRAAGLPPFSPHRVRDTIAELAREHCRTPEDYKAWSQNMGHENVLTTFRSYGSVATGRQIELMDRFRKRGPILGDDDYDLIE